MQLYFGVEKCCVCTCQALQTGMLGALSTQRTISKLCLIWNIENFPGGPAHLGHKYRLHHRVILKSELILLKKQGRKCQRKHYDQWDAKLPSVNNF